MNKVTAHSSKQDSVPVPTCHPVSIFFPIAVDLCPRLHYMIAMMGASSFELLNFWTNVILFVFTIPSEGSKTTLCLQSLPFKAEATWSSQNH